MSPTFIKKSSVPLVTASLANFLIVLDMTMINVAISSVVRGLDTSVNGLQGAIAGYALILAAFTILGGKLGYNYGIRRVFIVGTLVYGIGTVMAAVSSSLAFLLLGWSVVKGLGAAAICPAINTIVVAAYDGSHRARAFGILGATLAVASACGPVLGGVLTTFVGWRSIFWVQVLFVVPLFWLSGKLTEPMEPQRKGPDWVGTWLSASGMSLIILGTVLAGNLGWWKARHPLHLAGFRVTPLGLSITPYLLAAGALLLVAFFHWESRQAELNGPVLLELGLFSNGAFMIACLTNTMGALVLAAFMFIVPVFLQSGLEFTPLQTGLAVLPASIGILVGSLIAPRLEKWVLPSRLAQLGIVVMGLGFWLYSWAIHPGLTILELILPYLAIGVGAGMMMMELSNLTLSAVTPALASEASGLDNSIRKLGSALGTAIAGSILMAAFYSSLVDLVVQESGVELTPSQRRQVIIALEDTFEEVQTDEETEIVDQLWGAAKSEPEDLVLQAAVDGKRTALHATLLLTFLTGLLATFLPGRRAD